ncbi:MAG: ATP-binding protein [Thermomicrobium sp.]|nr:ATP-binding protein [Thermomicrobium sp.]
MIDEHERSEGVPGTRFVDREAELSQLVALLGQHPAGVVAVVGPPGIGKSVLLRALVRCLSEIGVPCATVDLSRVRDEHDVVASVARQLGVEARTLAELFAVPGRRVLVLDDYVPDGAFDRALRLASAERRGELALVVAMSCQPPPSWLHDAEWSTRLQVVQLDGLPTAAAARYLERFGIDSATAERLAWQTAGHPLTLTLLAQQFVGMGGRLPRHALLEAAEAVLELALGQLGEEEDAAVEVAALAGVLSEGTLRAALGNGSSTSLLRQLAHLPIAAVTPYGLVLREPFGSFLRTSLAWRDPERLLELTARLRRTSGEAIQHGSSSLRFPHVVRLLLLADEAGGFRRAVVAGLTAGLTVGTLRRDEVDTALSCIASIPLRTTLRAWLEHGLLVSRAIRDGSGRLLGWVTSLPLEAAVWENETESRTFRDGILAVLPLRSGERAVLHVTGFAATTAERTATLAALALALHVERLLALPRYAWSVFCGDAEHPAQSLVVEFLGAHLVPAPVSDECALVALREWRRRSVSEWLQEPGSSDTAGEGLLATEPIDRETFARAVAAALRDWSRPERLRGNPLLSSRIVLREAGSGEAQRIHALRQVLARAIAELGLRPQYQRWQAVAESAYLHPVEAQERMAERLGIPFSTYRRYLKAATDWMVDALWQAETGDADDLSLVLDAPVPAVSLSG